MNQFDKLIGYIGTYTKGDSRGIYRFVLDLNEEKITGVETAAELDSPTYLTISKDNRNLYAVTKEGGSGGVASFEVNSQSGDLTANNSQVTEGVNPCYISVNQANSIIVTANYHTTKVESWRVNEAGSVTGPISSIEHKGHGPHERQEKPHLHYANFSPDEKYVVAVDLGSDRILTYKNKEGKLEEHRSLATRAGTGPRHLVFHPNGKYAYVMTELSSEVIVLRYHEDDGSFSELQYISTIPKDFKENNQGSAIYISGDGKFLYAGNRGHNSIACFQVNDDGDEVEFVSLASTEGDWPRDFALVPGEKFMVVANQDSGNLVLFSRDGQTGELKKIQSDISVPDPVSVEFLHQ